MSGPELRDLLVEDGARSPRPFTAAQEARIRELIAEAFLTQAELTHARLLQVLALFKLAPIVEAARRASDEGP